MSALPISGCLPGRTGKGNGRHVNRQRWLLHTVTAGVLVVGLGWATSASADAIFDFEGTDAGGTGSATMQFSGVGTSELTVNLDNTSPTTLDDGTENANAPGITGFGFDGVAPLPNLTSWSLMAQDVFGDSTLIGGSPDSGSGDWTLGSFMAGVDLDFLPQVDTGMDGALFNPDAAGLDELLPGGQNAVYFTTASLILNFDGDFTPDFDDQFSPFVRMQNVGLNQAGSLRLGGTPGDNGIPTDPIGEIPVPATLGLLGFGLIATGVAMRRRRS